MMSKTFFISGILWSSIVVGQVITWEETTQPDFADGFIDPNLYASWRANMETNPGCVEWFPRFDINSDGFPDIISVDNHSPYLMRVWYMSSTGLADSQLISIGASGGGCDMADLNCDGRAEVIHSGLASDSAVIYWNFHDSVSVDDITKLPNNRAEAVYVADLDKDGYLDIILACGGDGTGAGGMVRIFWGETGYLYSPSDYTDIPIYSGADTSRGLCHNIECADFDDDADLDIAVVSWMGADGVYILENLDGRSFSLHKLRITAVNPDHHGLSVGDLDLDGDIDIVATYYLNLGYSDIYYNNGTWDFDTAVLNPGECYGGSVLWDYNDDGALDILYLNGRVGSGYRDLTLYYNDGTGHFADSDTVILSPFRVATTGGTVMDFDGDGNDDIFVNGYNDYSFIFYGPDFTRVDSLPVSSDHHGVFREAGNIRDRSKSAFYLSNIFDTGHLNGICSGYVSWVAYDHRDYYNHPHFSLPDPLGSEVRIFARGGNAPHPDPSWTSWVRLTDEDSLPPAIMGYRFLQYKAELWYENVSYLPWIEQIEFVLIPCDSSDTIPICQCNIDTLWFSEETDCDSVNTVEICYILSNECGDSVPSGVELYLSTDGGTTWISAGESDFGTFSDYTGDYGDSVYPGTHCFQWLLSADIPDLEISDGIVRAVAECYGSDTSTMDTFEFAGILDSRAPRIELYCDGEDTHPNDTLHLRWHYEDMFPYAGCFDLLINICGTETSFCAGDTVLDFVVPEDISSCGSLEVVIFPRDSFCNINADSCIYRFECERGVAEILCAPCGGITSCSNQGIYWLISDTTGARIDTSGIFVSVYRFFSGGCDTFNLTTGSGIDVLDVYSGGAQVQIFVESPTSNDRDSIYIVIDSVFNEFGCKILP